MGLGWHSTAQKAPATSNEGGSSDGMSSAQAERLITSVEALAAQMGRMAAALEETCLLTVDCEEQPVVIQGVVQSEANETVTSESGATVVAVQPAEIQSEANETVVSESGATVVAEAA